MERPAVFAIADDLSGAAEAAAALAMPFGALSAAGEVHLGVPRGPSSAPVTVIDLDSRAALPDRVRASIRGVLAASPPAAVVYAKVDSLWRGAVAATVAALLERGHAVVFAPSLPAAGRLLIDGRLIVGGVPLHESASWAMEASEPPRHVHELLAGLPLVEIPLPTVRADAGALTAAIAEAAHGAPAVVVCDAETDEDLDRVVAAATAVPAARLVGSGGLALALGRRLSAPGGAPVLPAPGPSSTGNPLFLIGTAESVAREQIGELIRHSDAVGVRLGAHEILGARPLAAAAHARITAALAEHPVVVHIDPALPILGDPAGTRAALLAALAGVARSSGAGRDLMLTGGETARYVLDALGIPRLSPLRVIELGTIASRAPDGRLVVTRPGSFGGPGNLLRILECFRKAS